MKYMCLCYYDPNVANALSLGDSEELVAACKPHYVAWEESGKLAAIGGLSDPQAWRSIRPTDTRDNVGGKPIVLDGPFLPGGHRVGAFFVVDAQDITEAVEIAAKHPTAHTGRFLGGGIEVCLCEAFEVFEPNANAASHLKR
jgi:hypothetical protein